MSEMNTFRERLDLKDVTELDDSVLKARATELLAQEKQAPTKRQREELGKLATQYAFELTMRSYEVGLLESDYAQPAFVKEEIC